MSRYSAQFRNTVLKKLLPPESRSALSLAKEYNLSVANIYSWRSKMRSGTLQVDQGVQANRRRQLSEKLSLLLESQSVDEAHDFHGREDSFSDGLAKAPG